MNKLSTAVLAATFLVAECAFSQTTQPVQRTDSAIINNIMSQKNWSQVNNDYTINYHRKLKIALASALWYDASMTVSNKLVNYGDIVSILRKANDIAPLDAEGLSLLASAESAFYWNGAAIRHFEEALKKKNGDVTILSKMAMAYARMSDVRRFKNVDGKQGVEEYSAEDVIFNEAGTFGEEERKKALAKAEEIVNELINGNKANLDTWQVRIFLDTLCKVDKKIAHDHVKKTLSLIPDGAFYEKAKDRLKRKDAFFKGEKYWGYEEELLYRAALLGWKSKQLKKTGGGSLLTCVFDITQKLGNTIEKIDSVGNAGVIFTIAGQTGTRTDMQKMLAQVFGEKKVALNDVDDRFYTIGVTQDYELIEESKFCEKPTPYPSNTTLINSQDLDKCLDQAGVVSFVANMKKEYKASDIKVDFVPDTDEVLVLLKGRVECEVKGASKEELVKIMMSLDALGLGLPFATIQIQSDGDGKYNLTANVAVLYRRPDRKLSE